jgi:hypothetical protein
MVGLFVIVKNSANILLATFALEVGIWHSDKKKHGHQNDDRALRLPSSKILIILNLIVYLTSIAFLVFALALSFLAMDNFRTPS